GLRDEMTDGQTGVLGTSTRHGPGLGGRSAVYRYVGTPGSIPKVLRNRRAPKRHRIAFSNRSSSAATLAELAPQLPRFISVAVVTGGFVQASLHAGPISAASASRTSPKTVATAPLSPAIQASARQRPS